MTDENRNPEDFDESPVPVSEQVRDEESTEAPRKEVIEMADLIAGRGGDKNVSTFSAVMIGLVCALLAFMITWVVMSGVYSSKLAEVKSDTGGIPAEAYVKLEQIKEILDMDFLYDIDEQNLTDMILKGYMYGLDDPYAEYFNKEEYESLVSDSNGERQGIGIAITLNTDFNVIQVTKVNRDSPAEKAGIRNGDLIIKVMVDGEMKNVADLGYTMAVSQLQGTAGTLAEFVVARGESLTETVEFSIERGFITEYTVDYRVHSIDSTVGVISIDSFDKKTPEQFEAAYNALRDSGCTKLVIDVRNNPGGELNSVCSILDMLVPEGVVARSVDKDGNEEILYVSDAKETDVPIAVLVNENTASAGELFAACLKDYKKATLVGTTTFGKGIMQTVIGFNDGTAFKYTNRYYCPPFSDNYHGVGVTPHVKCELPEEVASHFYTMTDAEDTQLAAAVTELNK